MMMNDEYKLDYYVVSDLQVAVDIIAKIDSFGLYSESSTWAIPYLRSNDNNYVIKRPLKYMIDELDQGVIDEFNTLFSSHYTIEEINNTWILEGEL
jgi:hypothetical protein